MTIDVQSPRFAVTRREFNRLAAAAGACVLARNSEGAAASKQSAFAHPGILHSATDLDRMRKGVAHGLSPIAAGFEKLRDDRFSQIDYAPHPFGAEVGRNPSVNFPAFDDDSNAAYQCSLMAAITGDKRYAALARTIVLGWSGSLQRVSGADAVLMAGLGPFKLINAAEILRAIGELDADGAALCAAMLRRAILATIVDFAPFANGNWDTAAIKTMLAMAVFCDDRSLFERALLYYLHGDGDGRLTHYIHGNGQCQESGRDQQHTQLGLAHMGDACEIAWHQGLDLYGAEENRLLRGFEYTAAYNLGEDVEFKPDIDRTGKYRHQVISPRSRLRPVYEQIFSHYHLRRGLPVPAVQRAVAELRPEGAAQGADHSGFGTLLYPHSSPEEKPRDARASPPAAVFVAAVDGAVDVSWLARIDSRGYSVERAEADEAFHRIRAGIMAETIRDNTVKRGKLYSYRIEAHGAGSHESSSEVAQIVAGLPERWSGAALGNPSDISSAQFDGKMLTIYTAGSGLLSPADEGSFVSAPSGCNLLEARFVPQTASQSAQFGLAYRKGLSADAACVALLVQPAAASGERRDWRMRLATRDGRGMVSAVSDTALQQPVSEYGRLMRPVWFRLRRSKTMILAQFSTDGTFWKDAGQVPEIENGVMGLIASSAIPGVNGAVRFDSLTTHQVEADPQ